MAAVQRRDEPRKFLDASLVPLERALRARAGELQADGAVAALKPLPDGGPGFAEAIAEIVRDALADELLKLADELHHW